MPNWAVSLGMLVTIAAAGYGLFFPLNWLIGKAWSSPSITVSSFLSALLMTLAISSLGTWWMVGSKEHDLTKFPNKPLELVDGKTFVGGVVEVDGKVFEHCTFRDTTLMYHGTDTFSLVNPRWQGSVYLRTDNKAIHDFEAMRLLMKKFLPTSIRVFELDINGNPHPID